MTEPASRRVFFALWPPEQTLQALDALAADVAGRCGGRRLRRDGLHMTLTFIGAVSPGQLAVLLDIAGKVGGEPFDLRLDRLDCWPHNRIAWLGCGKTPSRQRRLFAALAGGLAAAGFVLDKRSFTPHVTLARNARCDHLPVLEHPIHWPVSEFVLVESCLQASGARYRELANWPLQPAAGEKKCRRVLTHLRGQL